MGSRVKRKIMVLSIVIIVLCASVFPKMKETDNIEAEPDNSISSQSQQSSKESNTSKASNKDSDNKNQNSIDEKAQGKDIVIVNKDYPLPEGYRPDDLRNVDIPFNHPDGSEMNMMRDEAAKHLEEMSKAAEADGIYLIGVSGFRSYEYQKKLYDDEVKNSGTSSADKLVAKPGYSEHNTGLAVDLFSEDHPTLDEDFENSKAFKWLQSNCAEYGFILRYPKDKENVTGYSYEPWHYRYVGKDIANVIMDSGVTLEEYLMG